MRYVLNAIRWEGKRAITFVVMVSKPGYRPVLHGVVCLLTFENKQKTYTFPNHVLGWSASKTT